MQAPSSQRGEEKGVEGTGTMFDMHGRLVQHGPSNCRQCERHQVSRPRCSWSTPQPVHPEPVPELAPPLSENASTIKSGFSDILPAVCYGVPAFSASLLYFHRISTCSALLPSIPPLIPAKDAAERDQVSRASKTAKLSAYRQLPPVRRGGQQRRPELPRVLLERRRRAAVVSCELSDRKV